MYNLFLHIWTPHSLTSIDKWQSYGHLFTFGPGLKMTPKPIDWVLQPLQRPANTVYLCICHFQIYSLVM